MNDLKFTIKALGEVINKAVGEGYTYIGFREDIIYMGRHTPDGGYEEKLIA